MDNHIFLKLPDVPPMDHAGLHSYLLQLQRIVEQMSGRSSEPNRVITYQDLIDLGLINN